MALRIRRGHKRSPSAPQVSHSPSSSISSSASTPTAQIQEAARAQAARAQAGPTPRRVAIVGTGREALALSPCSADAFAQSLNLSMAVCSSPEVNVHFPTSELKPIPNPGPVRELRRIASEAGFAPRPQSVRIPPPPQNTMPKGLPPPPRPQRRRPPPVLVSKLGAPIAQAEQSDSPFTATTPRASSVPPSAVSSFWGCAGPQTAKSLRTSRSYASHMGSVSTTTSAGSDSELDLDGLDMDEFDFSSTEDEDVKSPLGGTYFPPRVDSPRRSRGAGPRPLRVQVSIEQVAFRDGSPVVRQCVPKWESEDEDEPRGAGVAYAGWEDEIKSRAAVEGSQPRTKRSIGRALGRWLRKHT